MKVNLIKEAVYDLNEKKSSQVPFDAFAKMACVDFTKTSGNALPKVRIFETIDEFKQSENFEQYDTTKDVHILKNGQFCVFLKEEKTDVVLSNGESDNATADTKEDTAEES